MVITGVFARRRPASLLPPHHGGRLEIARHVVYDRTLLLLLLLLLWVEHCPHKAACA